MRKSVSSEKAKFDPKAFLATIDHGRTISDYSKKQSIFAQGDPSDAVFYIQEGKDKTHRCLDRRERSHHRSSQRW
jgi:CRP-like cAMP-binding protein